MWQNSEKKKSLIFFLHWIASSASISPRRDVLNGAWNKYQISFNSLTPPRFQRHHHEETLYGDTKNFYCVRIDSISPALSTVNRSQVRVSLRLYMCLWIFFHNFSSWSRRFPKTFPHFCTKQKSFSEKLSLFPSNQHSTPILITSCLLKNSNHSTILPHLTSFNWKLMAEKREVFRFSFLAKTFPLFSCDSEPSAVIKAHQFPHRHRRELERSQVSSFHSRTTLSTNFLIMEDHGKIEKTRRENFSPHSLKYEGFYSKVKRKCI